MPAHSPQKLFADLGFVVIVPLLMAQKESQQRTAVLCYHCRAAHRTFDRKVAYPLTKFESVVAPSRHFMSDSHAGSIPAALIRDKLLPRGTLKKCISQNRRHHAASCRRKGEILCR